MTKHLILSTLVALAVAGPLRADEAESKPAGIQDLDQRVRILERDLENQAADAAEAKKNAAFVTANPNDGFGVYSADKSYGIKFGGLVQIDDRTFFDDLATPTGVSVSPKSNYQSDIVLPRRARLSQTISLGAKAGAFLQEEFNTANPVLVDAYGELKPTKWATLRVGLQKTPLSLERWRSDPARDFVEFSYLAGLVTDRDTGAWLELKDADQIGYFGAGVFNGSNDTGTVVLTDTNKDKDAVAKVFFQPFRAIDTVSLRDIGFGVAGSAGNHSGAALPSYKSLGQGQTIFSLSNTASVKAGQGGGFYRLVPQAYAYWRGLGLLGEYLREGGSYSYLGKESYLTTESWDVQAGYWLTGEDASFGPVKLNPSTSHSWGALQLVGRYSGINFDSGFIGNAANPGPAVTGATAAKYINTNVSGVSSWDAGLNYVPVNNVKLLVDYAESRFTNGGGRDNAGHNLALIPEKVLFTRVQFNF